MNETELKPCPFCGGKAKIERAFLTIPEIHSKSYDKNYLQQNFTIECEKCGIGIPEFKISLEIDITTLSLKDDFKTPKSAHNIVTATIKNAFFIGETTKSLTLCHINFKNGLIHAGRMLIFIENLHGSEWLPYNKSKEVRL